MVKCRGIAATATSALIFSVILISNLALFSSSQDRQRLYSQANAGDSLYDQSMAAAASAEAQALIEAQASIGSTVMDCRTAGATVASIISGISIIANSRNVSVIASSGEPANGISHDDPSLGQFEGFVVGDVNLPISINAAGTNGEVQFKTSYFVSSHLPAHLSVAIGDCLGGTEAIESALSASVLRSCNTTTIESLLRRAGGAFASVAARDGLAFGFSYFFASTNPCDVQFTVTVEQTGINGPGGIFSLCLREDGSASGPPALSPPPRSTTRTVPE